MFLSLLAFCQSQLKPHLQFSVMLGFFGPIASLVPHLGPQAPGILLPVRLCVVIRAWASEIPENALVSVVQLLQGFLRNESPKAVRLAALSPLRAMLDRFSDSEAWTEVQGALIDSCLALLYIVQAPEVQWRCLNLIHLFLVEEAESGRYQATEKTLEQLVALWRRPEEGELLIRHALLDVLRALVLMSDRTRSPRLSLSPPLLSCCLTVISDCYAAHRGPSSPQRSGYEASAALQADAESAAGALGDAGSATATLFDSGSVLFLGVLRTVDVEQAAPLMPFFPKLLAQQTALGGRPPEWTMDILLEYCALHCSGGAAAHLVQFYPALLQICQSQLNLPDQSRTTDMCLQLLQLLVAHAPTADALVKAREVAAPLLRLWVTTASNDAGATKSAFAYPITTFLGLIGAWHASHPRDFLEQASAVGPQRVALLLAVSCKQAAAVALRCSIISAALALAESGVDPTPVLEGDNECLYSPQRMQIKVALLSGKVATLHLSEETPLLELRRLAQDQLQVTIKDLITAEGQLLNRFQALQEAGLKDGDTLSAMVRRATVISKMGAAAFALLKGDGGVVTWGDPSSGGRSTAVQEQLQDIQDVVASDGAFAAIRADGSVVTWGDPDFGGDSRYVQEQLTKVTKVVASAYAFAAIRSNGSVVTWGVSYPGGDSRAVQAQLRDVRHIVASSYSFAAIRSDGTVVAWGSKATDIKFEDRRAQLQDVVEIVASQNAFAALRFDGRVIIWGDFRSGARDDMQNVLVSVTQIAASQRAFAATCADGSVITWGVAECGGDSSSVHEQLKDVKKVVASQYAFAAILGDGSVVTWGQPGSGGDSSSVQPLRQVLHIMAAKKAFAALRSDGSVVCWGHWESGGVRDDELTDVVELAASSNAFAALRSDGSVVTWGSASFGGDSSAVQNQLTAEAVTQKHRRAYTFKRKFSDMRAALRSYRSASCFRPADVRRSNLKEDGSLEDTAVARWLFGRLAALLKQLGATHGEQVKVAYETAYFSTVYQPRDGGAGLIHMIPGNWPINVQDMDELFPGMNYLSQFNAFAPSQFQFFQSPQYGWKSVAAWYKRTNSVIPGCGQDLFDLSYEEQTRCILSRVVDRQEAFDIVGSCLSAAPST
ncbi:HERC2, partial [Symbiodinium sp. KB8]